jgi:hypothetical protein
MRWRVSLLIVVFSALSFSNVFAGEDILKLLLGSWEYKARDTYSATGYEDEGERLELYYDAGSIRGLYFGLEREGEHGLYYSLVELKDVKVNKAGEISFIVPGRDFFTKRPHSLTEIKSGKTHPVGATRFKLKMQGDLQGEKLVIHCISDYPTGDGECSEDIMVFQKRK